MTAFILDRYGSADHVRAGDVPDPELREHDILIQIHAAGVNQLDSKIRNGEFTRILPYRLPLILGHDVAMWSSKRDAPRARLLCHWTRRSPVEHWGGVHRDRSTT